MRRYIWQRKEWPALRWDAEPLLSPLGECRLLQGRLLGTIERLGRSGERQAQAELLVRETVATADIEGERLDETAVRAAVAGRLGFAPAGQRLDRKIDELVAVLYDATQHCDRPLTQERLWGWQQALFPSGNSGTHKVRVGGWRDCLEPMQVISEQEGQETIHYEAPPSERVDREMALFLEWFARSRGKMEGVVRAGVAHLWFLTIHPFDDGNGRVARAITDLALAQDGGRRTRYYSLSSQILADRESYCRMLEDTQKGTCDVTGWLVWFLKFLCRTIRRSEEILGGTVSPGREASRR